MKPMTVAQLYEPYQAGFIAGPYIKPGDFIMLNNSIVTPKERKTNHLFIVEEVINNKDPDVFVYITHDTNGDELCICDSDIRFVYRNKETK